MADSYPVVSPMGRIRSSTILKSGALGVGFAQPEALVTSSDGASSVTRFLTYISGHVLSLGRESERFFSRAIRDLHGMWRRTYATVASTMSLRFMQGYDLLYSAFEAPVPPAILTCGAGPFSVYVKPMSQNDWCEATTMAMSRIDVWGL